MNTEIRPPAVAGSFYPAQPTELAQTVDALLVAALERSADRPRSSPPKALILPHAGYAYSGAIAATGYATLAGARDAVRRVVLLGPAHRVAVEGCAIPGVGSFVTPLGSVEIDDEAREVARALPGVVMDDTAHALEHSVEVHLPFLQRVLSRFRVLPVVVGRVAPNSVALLLDTLWGGPETLFIVSSDLSHYEDHASASAHDRVTAAAILNRHVEAIQGRDACGAYPLRGLLTAASEHGLEIELLDLRNSGDTSGARDRVVGYGAFVLTETARAAA